MVDVDPRVATGLRELAGRAPVDSEVWSAAERYVVRRRRQRHTFAGAAVAIIVVTGGLVTAAAVHGGGSAPSVGSNPTPTTAATALLAPAGPIEGSFTIGAGPAGRLVYEPTSISVSTGIYAVTLADRVDTEHTLRFGDPSTLSSDLIVNNSGDTKTTRVFFGHPGDYAFYCVVTGHRAAGMQGVVHVTGPAMTLAQAEASARP